MNRTTRFAWKAPIKAISLDITGTILIHKLPIEQVYLNAARSVGLVSLEDNEVSYESMKSSFHKAFKTNSKLYPCYGSAENLSEREWWKRTVTLTFRNAMPTKDLSALLLDICFRKIYQHYGSPASYTTYCDAISFLERLSRRGKLSIGVLTNSNFRTIETVMPMLNIDHHFDWFVSCNDIGVEKPHRAIFERSLAVMNSSKKFQLMCHEGRSIPRPDNILPENVLHIGDSLMEDFYGARDAGWNSLYLNRLTTTSRDLPLVGSTSGVVDSYTIHSFDGLEEDIFIE